MGEIIAFEDFVNRKIAWYVQMWKYRRHDDDAFTHNMKLMGFSGKDIKECIEEYYNEDD
tara:strand:- start:1782 stop:1958 length:177 start_codon:yes stop_codon:yes gene_type:complete